MYIWPGWISLRSEWTSIWSAWMSILPALIVLARMSIVHVISITINMESAGTSKRPDWIHLCYNHFTIWTLCTIFRIFQTLLQNVVSAGWKRTEVYGDIKDISVEDIKHIFNTIDKDESGKLSLRVRKMSWANFVNPRRSAILVIWLMNFYARWGIFFFLPFFMMLKEILVK